MPGWGGSIADLGRLRRDLADGFRVVVVDLPGSGRSQPQPRHYTPLLPRGRRRPAGPARRARHRCRAPGRFQRRRRRGPAHGRPPTRLRAVSLHLGSDRADRSLARGPRRARRGDHQSKRRAGAARCLPDGRLRDGQRHDHDANVVVGDARHPRRWRRHQRSLAARIRCPALLVRGPTTSSARPRRPGNWPKPSRAVSSPKRTASVTTSTSHTATGSRPRRCAGWPGTSDAGRTPPLLSSSVRSQVLARMKDLSVCAVSAAARARRSA